MFQHAYDGYLRHGAPYDELRPLSCDGIDTWGSYSLTLIDALDTLAVMGNYTEFARVVELLNGRSFDADINVSVFETNIRIVGGLLSAHLLSHQAGLEAVGLVEPGWPCEGPLLRMAEDVAQRLLPAFETATGMPYGTVNLRHGVPYGETAVTCTAGIGTFILEFGTLSRLTGNPVYEDVAMNALHALYDHRSPIGLYGNHIDVQTGRWIAQDAGIGAGVDSYYEYLIKGSLLLEQPDLMATFLESKAAIDRYLKRDDWYVWVSMTKGQLTLPVFQSLEAYWPGLLSLYGSTTEALRVLHSYQAVWRQYGFLPEFYNIPTGEAGTNRENYPLRPELIESVMYLYRATGDPFLLEVGENMLESIEHSAKTACGYATIRNVQSHQQEDRMESFFLAETTKYLYLLFDPSNFLHNDGRFGSIVQTTVAGETEQCVVAGGGYIFNTEAHPIDPMALRCCEARHTNMFATTDASHADQPSHRGELYQRGSKKNMKSKQADSGRQEAGSTVDTPIQLQTTVANPVEEMKPIVSDDKIDTTKLPSSTISRDIMEDGDGTGRGSGAVDGGVKSKTISSTVTVSSQDQPSQKPPNPEELSEPAETESDEETTSSTATTLTEPDLLMAVPPTSGKPDDLIVPQNAPMVVVDEVRSLDGERQEKDGSDEDKPAAMLVKLVQDMFRSAARHASGSGGGGGVKFDREKFYHQWNRASGSTRKDSFNDSSTASSGEPLVTRPRYDLLTCRAQPYLQRLTLMGEFY
ncbi:mannosyl-oligosaccharide 1,2-alpha-mannosidase IB [Anopheles sinensis]|uniref:alpha-1,2-Mannosidase n=1 Tax=Anopheles sinensis TaxID=74873 RepID=A0A084W5N1_ANOSI|nr:mannosyl-oligosaccharide 1,2-alpha-mannosidase IB [Anopheles sinensis]